MKSRENEPKQGALPCLEPEALSHVVGGHWGVGNGLVVEASSSADQRSGYADSPVATAARAHWGVGNG